MARFPVSGNGLASETEPAKLSASELPASVVSDTSATPKDIDSTGVNPQQVLAYDPTSQKFKPANGGDALLANANTWAQEQTMPDLIIGGMPGATASGRFAGLTAAGAPSSGTFLTHDFILSLADGKWYVCTAGGTPGTWITPSSGAGGATLLAHTATKSTTANNVTTSAIDTSGATLLVAAIGYYPGGGGTQSLSDSKGNTWTALTAQTFSSAAVQLFYCASPTVGTGHTFTTTGTAGSAPAIAVAAFSGVTGAGDVSVGGTGATSTVQPGSGTPAHANEVLITAVDSFHNGETYSVDSGFTITDQQSPVSGQANGVALAYLIQTAATAENPTWTGSGGTDNRVAVMGSWS